MNWPGGSIAWPWQAPDYYTNMYLAASAVAILSAWNENIECKIDNGLILACSYQRYKIIIIKIIISKKILDIFIAKALNAKLKVSRDSICESGLSTPTQ